MEGGGGGGVVGALGTNCQALTPLNSWKKNLPRLKVFYPLLFLPPSLTELTTLAFDQKPQLVKRQVLPVMWHLLTAKTSASAEGKTAMLALCAALYDLMGQTFLDSAGNLSPEHQTQLEQLVHSLNR